MIKKSEFEFGENSFDWLRVFSAVIIILGHCTIYMDFDIHPFFEAILNSWIGLFCLFTLTGYLVPASLERSKSNVEYLKKRFFRLYPGLWLALILSLVCVLVIGGIKGLIFDIKDIFLWIVAQMSFFQFYTPVSIEQYGVGNPNGALWSISMEIFVYVIIMLCWRWLKNLSIKLWMILIGISIIVNVLFGYCYSMIPPIIAKLINVTFIPYAYVFLIGMFCYAYKEKIIPKLARLFVPMAVIYVIWFVVDYTWLHSHFGHYANAISGLFIAFLTMSIGYRWGKHRIKYEISYGLYIYHMIIINIFVMFGLKDKWYWMLVILFITFCLSIMSHLFVEKPIMNCVNAREKTK